MCRPYKETNLPAGTYVHVRYFKELRKSPWLTIAQLRSDVNDEVLSQGSSTCSQRDNPVRKIGRAIAVGRALKAYDQIAA